MNGEAVALRRIEDAETIPDGEYAGTWGGYGLVTFTVNGVEHEAQLRHGIRTTWAECTVTVRNGAVAVVTTTRRAV